MSHFKTVYPFTSIVGQDKMKKALLLNAINPKIGGVLIKGEKGTAKSTAVRALANLLPDLEVVDGCAYGCSPRDRNGMCHECLDKNGSISPVFRKMRVVELPISSTEDKVVGTLDIEHAIKKGEKKFEPGILAQAHRNILYVDEVNLLNDHIVDVLLDAAAMGVNNVEREGVSYSHPSQFILVGTMNPEEGELRPQLLDRFGLCVEIEGIKDAGTRMEIVEKRIEFERDPEAFSERSEAAEKSMRELILQAMELLPQVRVSREMLGLIVQICIDMQVDGHRADLAMLKTASTIAALNRRTEVAEEDVKEAAELVLQHRMRRKPFSQQKMDNNRLEQSMQKNKEKQQQQQQQHQQPHQPREPEQKNEPMKKDQQQGTPDASSEAFFQEGEPFRINQAAIKSLLEKDSKPREGLGRRSPTTSTEGKYIRSKMPAGKVTDLALDATIRAAAPYQLQREGDFAVRIKRSDIREKVRERKIGNTILFAVDASGSMGAEARMTAVKGAILSLLMDAYQKRDKVGLVVFKGDTAELLLPPTQSVELARKFTEELPVGGKTPLAHGLLKSYEVLKREIEKDHNAIPLLVLVSDGKANVSLNGGKPLDEAKDVASLIRNEGIRSIVIDSGRSFVDLGLARQISSAMDGRYLKIDELKAEEIIAGVKSTG